MAIRLLIVGAGGHGRSIAEAARMSDRSELAGFVDDSLEPSIQVMGVPVLGSGARLANYLGQADMAIAAVGNNRVREEFHVRLHSVGFALATIVHPGAIVSPSATIGPGCAIIGTEAWLGEGAIVNCGAVADHHCRVEDFGHLGVNASMAGGSVLGRGAWMKAGSSLGYGVRIDAGLVLEPGQAVSEIGSRNAIQ